MISRDNHRDSQIGVDRLVRLNWLERTAYLVLAGNDASSVKAALQDDLRRAFRSGNTKVRGSLDKTITVLMKIWVRPPRHLHLLLREGLAFLSLLPREDHIAIHWGMTMAVYPFWEVVATHVGRLLRLQGTISANQVQRRVREQYGERETVLRRTRYVLRSFVDWGVLKEASEKGLYAAGLSRDIARVELIAWLVEAFLHAHPSGSMDLRAVLASPSLFPFRLSQVPAPQLVAVSERLEVLRHGLDQDLIMLRTESLPTARGAGS